MPERKSLAIRDAVTASSASAAKKYRTEPAAKIVDSVTKSLADFVAGAPQADDITLVVAKLV